MPTTPHKCPSCAHDSAHRIRFTAWGGVIGPRVFSLVKCAGCGIQYNGKSGRRVEKAIRVYTTAMLGVLVLLAALMIYSFLADGSAGVKKPARHGEPAEFVS